MSSSTLLTCLGLLIHLLTSPSTGYVATAPDFNDDLGFFTNDPVPSLPLAVKSPYLSAWLPIGSNEPHLAGRWPQFWAGQDLGWTGFIRVDDQTYTFMGNPAQYGQKIARQLFYKFSATRTVFGFQAADIQFNVTFFTPVDPDDPVKQSLPFSFYEISIEPSKQSSKERHVEVYTDISGEHVCSDGNMPAFWQTGSTKSLVYHSIELYAPQLFDERNEQIMSGRAVLSAEAREGLTYKTGGHHTVRESFTKNGSLDNGADQDYRRIGDNWPVLAFAQSFVVSPKSREAQNVRFIIGHVRDPAISYRPSVVEEVQSLGLLYYAHYGTWQTALQAFHDDYAVSLAAAKALDLMIYHEASSISHSYAKICALSLRQAFASIELTGSSPSSIQAWMKEISSDGNLNTVDVIYPAMPLFLYVAPQYLKWLIEPLLRYQAQGAEYAACAHDLGEHYPYATGPSDGKDSHMPVEESGNILIIALAHAQATGDNSLIQQYYGLFEKWTDYLMRKALIPESQLSTDDFMGPITNSSSLALKGGIGIYAMGELADLIGRDGSIYRTAAQEYIKKWREMATSADHSHEEVEEEIKKKKKNKKDKKKKKKKKKPHHEPVPKHLLLSYHEQDTWMLAYNLYAEKLLGIRLVPEEVYQEQDLFYPTQQHAYGIPLDSRRTQTKTDWLLWSAAATSNETIANMLIEGVASYLKAGRTDAPFSDWYDTSDGTSPGFRARPVVGGHFAHLALRAMEKRRSALRGSIGMYGGEKGQQIVLGG